MLKMNPNISDLIYLSFLDFDKLDDNLSYSYQAKYRVSLMD